MKRYAMQNRNGEVFPLAKGEEAPAGCQLVAVVPIEDREQVERLVREMPEEWSLRGFGEEDDAHILGDSIDGVQAALREFANPTPVKPDEPQGLGAVVEDAKGLRWTRAGSSPLDGNWLRTGSNVYVDYIDINAVRVLSEGVS